MGTAQASPRPLDKESGPARACIVLAFAACCACMQPIGDASTPATPHPTVPNPNTAMPSPPPAPTPDPTVPSVVVSATPTTGGAAASVGFRADPNTTVVDFQTSLLVPAAPPATGTLFLWPGLQPGGANFLPIDNGVLQPVLTWGTSCAPGPQPAAYSTWWVSGQYVNTYGKAAGHTGCNGGDIMPASPGDVLVMHFALHDQTRWLQTITNQRTGQSVQYDVDMLAQAQNAVLLLIEAYDTSATTEVIFTDTTFALAAADPNGCAVVYRGSRDGVGVTLRSPDNMHCSVSKIVLRADGVTASDPLPAGP